MSKQYSANYSLMDYMKAVQLLERGYSNQEVATELKLPRNAVITMRETYKQYRNSKKQN